MMNLSLIEYIYFGTITTTILSLYFNYTLTAVLYCGTYNFYSYINSKSGKLEGQHVNDATLIANIVLLVFLSTSHYILFLYLPLVPYLINESYTIINDKSIINKYYNTLLRVINQITKQLFNYNDIQHYLQLFTSQNYIILIIVYLVMIDNQLFELAHEIPLKFSFFGNLVASFIAYNKYCNEYHLHDYIRRLHVIGGGMLVVFTDNWITYNIGLFICLYHLMHYFLATTITKNAVGETRKRQLTHTYQLNSSQMPSNTS